MKLEFQPARSDIIAYQYAVRQRTREHLGSSKVLRLLWLVAAGAVLGVFLIAVDRLMAALTGWETNPLSLYAGLICGAGTIMAINWNTYFKLRKWSARSNGPTLAPHVVETSDSGIAVRSPFLSATYQWSMFTSVTETKDVVVLWSEPLSGMIVPRSAFSSETDLQTFLTEVRRHIKPATAA